MRTFLPRSARSRRPARGPSPSSPSWAPPPVRARAGCSSATSKRSTASRSASRRPRARTADLIEFADERPCRALLAARMHASTHRMAADLRALAEPVSHAPVLLARLCNDSLAAERYARELARGWSALVDALAGVVREPESPLWREWAQRVRGETRPAVLREHIAVIA
jgi:hypothetical protein